MYHTKSSTVIWIIAHISRLTCHLADHRQRHLSGINTIFKMVSHTRQTAG